MDLHVCEAGVPFWPMRDVGERGPDLLWWGVNKKCGLN